MMRSVATSAAASTTSVNTQAAAGTDEGEKKTINPELWQACAGPLVNLPAAGTHVVYFPQGHSEQVAASMKKDVDGQIPNYPNLPSKLLCLLHNVTLHADPDTDEVYAQMTLQPVPSFDKEALLRSDLSLKVSKPQPDFFCKTLTASDTSTHGGFSVPRRAAEKIFPPLDYKMQPPAQELVAKDLHDTVWTFRHIYRGQPKRHLLTTGWSLFVSGKRLFAGDSVLFIRDDRQQLLLGLRRANRQPTNLSSSVLSTDSMHIGILAAAAHAAANNSPFTIFYNPRTSPTEFVIPLAKYYRALYGQQISLGMRFRMLFETEESGTRRYMGTITGISDVDPVRWKSSQWRNLQVGWDESTAGDRRNRVSAWEIEPVTAPFFICPPPFLGAKRPRQPGMPDDYSSDLDNLLKRTMPWLGTDMYMKDPQSLNGMNLVQWMNMQQIPSLQPNTLQPNNYHHSFPGSGLPNLPSAVDMSRQLAFAAPQATMHQNNLQFNMQTQQQQSVPLNNSCPVAQSQPHEPQNMINQHSSSNQIQSQIVQSSLPMQNHSNSQDTSFPSLSSSLQNNLLQRSGSGQIPTHQQQQQQQPMFDQSQLQSLMASSQLAQLANHQGQVSGNQLQRQLLQNLQQHQQQQPLLSQQTSFQQSSQLASLQDQQKPLLDASQSFSRSMAPASQGLECPPAQAQAHTTSLTPQSQMLAHQMSRGIPFSQQPQPQPQPPQIPKPQPQQQQPAMDNEARGLMTFGSNMLTRQMPASGSGNFSGATGLLGQSVVTDDIPSCSTSPSTNNCPTIQTTVNRIPPQCNMVEGMIARSSSLPFSLEGLETMSTNGNSIKDFHSKSEIKPSVNVSKANQRQEFLMQQAFQNIPPVNQIDYLDTSSATSASLSQSDAHLNQNNSSFNSQSILLRDPSHEMEVPAEAQNCAPSMINIDGQNGSSLLSESMLKKNMVGSVNDFTNLESGGLLTNFDNCKDAQQELSSSMVTQSFGVPDIAFNSIDSTMSDSSFLNRNTWGPPPQYQRMRSYTKVYKRGAVGRSIDVTRYSGYEELKQDLARRFGIEGQLEDRGRVGWKLVYVDHEDDVLLVGDDPWEEFVRCVRHIKILSPQEVQQMSLDGDYGNPSLPNQACSSSDNV